MVAHDKYNVLSFVVVSASGSQQALHKIPEDTSQHRKERTPCSEEIHSIIEGAPYHNVLVYSESLGSIDAKFGPAILLALKYWPSQAFCGAQTKDAGLMMGSAIHTNSPFLANSQPRNIARSFHETAIARLRNRT